MMLTQIPLVRKSRPTGPSFGIFNMNVKRQKLILIPNQRWPFCPPCFWLLERHICWLALTVWSPFYCNRSVSAFFMCSRAISGRCLLASCAVLHDMIFRRSQATPNVLGMLINFVTSGEEMWKGYFYMILLVVLNMIKTIMNSQYFYGLGLIGLRIRSALTSALFKKALVLGPSARKELTSNYELYSFLQFLLLVCVWSCGCHHNEGALINCSQKPSNRSSPLNSFIERALCLF